MAAKYRNDSRNLAGERDVLKRREKTHEMGKLSIYFAIIEQNLGTDKIRFHKRVFMEFNAVAKYIELLTAAFSEWRTCVGN